VTGTPADNLKATLTLLAKSPSGLQPGLSFNAVTNRDGRVKEWSAAEDGTTLEAIMDKYGQGDKIACSIKLEIGAWYEERGVESFWPEVEIKFYVKKGERHYHVPCLVGPWTYTTYRGS